MGRIELLSDETINRISAGEVIERPASVVRELVDNAVDAGADEISVYIEGGGRELVRVVDNGSGIKCDDAALAFKRHATSKIKKASDLCAIYTHGFRGEALSSIAAVSKVRLKTREKGRELGFEIAVEGGRVVDSGECSASPGTDIASASLFFNTPARRKFLRTPRTEELKIKAWLKQAAVPYPGIRYRLFSDGREVLNFPRCDRGIERVKTWLKGSFVEVLSELPDMTISGLIAHPGEAGFRRSSLTLLVNNRVVSDKLLVRAVHEGFASTLKYGETPVGVLDLRINPALVDVNVHPQKTEVRFRDPQGVFRLVREGVNRAVKQFRTPVFAAAAVQPNKRWEFNNTAPQPGASIPSGVSGDSGSYQQAGVQERASFHISENQPVYSAAGSFCYTDLKYIGQALSCYLFFEFDERVYVIDMHAAHERCTYNTVRDGFKNRSVKSQQLLIPVAVALDEERLDNCLKHNELFERYGFTIEPFGDDTLVVRSAPAVLDGRGIEKLVFEVSGIDLDGTAEGKFSEVADRIAARIACHASIRSGRELKKEEVYALLEALDRAETSSACPHGRPVITAFEKRDIERWFGRDK